jgi:hypothetical protein
MLYACRSRVVRNSNCLRKSQEIRFSWLPLSTIKCSEVPFTHICERKRLSPSLGSSRSFGWIVEVMTIVLGSTSIIYPILWFTELESELGLVSISFSSATNDCFEQHSSVLCQGILWKSHHFLVSLFIFMFLLFSRDLDWFS